jgi:hypothetical protein
MSVNAWEYSFSNPSNSATTSTSAADTSSGWDQFNLDPSTFNFGDYGSDLSADFPGYRPTGVIGDIYGLSAEELEYTGLPTEYPGMTLPGINSDVYSFAAHGDLPRAVCLSLHLYEHSNDFKGPLFWIWAIASPSAFASSACFPISY